jgi:Ca-activated chloride channel family protein
MIMTAAVTLGAAQTDTPAVYRAGTDLVVLQVAVTDPQRRFVSGLRAENFSVFEEGAPQRIELFQTAESPLDVMVLIDTSASMYSRIDITKRAAIDLVKTLRPGDRVGLILFNTIVTLTRPLTDDRDSVIAGIRTATPIGATAMYESIYLALHTLTRARQAQQGVRRQALVVLSDGQDNASHIPFEQALEAARTSDVTIFTIVPGEKDATPLPEELNWLDRTMRFEMRRLAEDTGGRTFVTTDAAELPGVYEQIANELREQYWLAYAPAGVQPGFRRVSVRVIDPPGLQARTRTGYNAGSRGTSRVSEGARP